MKKKIVKTLLVIAMLVGSFYIGMKQGKTEVLEGYVKLEECIPLEDVSCYFIGKYDYPCFELKDYGNQLDNPQNRTYEDIMASLEEREGYNE